MLHNSSQSEAAGTEAPGRRWFALLEFSLVAALFIADHYRLVPVSKTPYLLLLAWISLRLRGVRWSALGWQKYRSWATTLLVGVGAGIAMEALELFVTQPLLMHLTGRPPDLDFLRPMIGNYRLLLLGLTLAWTLAAFGEELVWRGYLMNRVAEISGGRRSSWLFSTIIVGIVFGVAHADQGITGVVENVINGWLLGAIYLACRRSLAVPIVAHGVTDSADLLLIFLGKYPTL